MIWPACEQWVRRWPRRGTRSGRAADLHGNGLELGGHQEVPPGVDVRPAPQQGPPLALGHAAPDPELGPAVQRVGQAVDPDRTAHADALGLVLRGTDHEQRFWIDISTSTAGSPFGIVGGPKSFGHSGRGHWPPALKNSHERNLNRSGP